MSQSMAEGSISPRAAFWASSLAAFAASRARPVVEGEGEAVPSENPRVLSSRLPDGLFAFGRQGGEFPDCGEPHAVFDELVSVFLYRGYEQTHERRDLLGRAVPVFGRERVERQEFDAGLFSRREHFPDSFCPFVVPVDAGLARALLPICRCRPLLWLREPARFLWLCQIRWA